VKQEILPGSKIFSRGDCVIFRLSTSSKDEGAAYLRTNIGRAAVKRQEIIDFTEKDKAILDRDWHDLPMLQKDENCWEIKLPLVEVGCFEAKCWFLRSADNKQLWPDGDNFRLKVEPSGNLCGNTIYTVFTRQFGRNISTCTLPEKEKAAREELNQHNYTVIPPSGTFRDVIKKLDFIINKLHSRIIQLLPVHPAPTVYGKMGTYGSPFAALDYFSVDPALAEFDKFKTPLDQFLELVDAVHSHNARIFLDIPVNHTGWASRLQSEHPEWFVRNPDGSFQSPGAWGVVWADLCKLDYQREEVHTLMANIFLYWCRHGVDGFRCDAGYMLPKAAWNYIVARVRREYPDTIFLLEGLGGPRDVQETLLCKAGLDWAYSELFQNYTREEIETYYPYTSRMSRTHGCFVSYAETHDNSRLAAKSTLYARMRTALTALFSHNGAFGITNGVEWFATEKISVHEACSLNWGNPDNQTAEIRRLQVLLETHPAFFADAETELITVDGANVAALRRTDAGTERELLILVNLNTADSLVVKWAAVEFGIEDAVYDLLTGKAAEIVNHGQLLECKLQAGQVLCLTRRREELDALEKAVSSRCTEPAALTRQRQRAELLKVYVRYHSYHDLSGLDIDALLDKLISSPEALCAELSGHEIPNVTVWNEDCDARRELMIPKDDLLLIKCKSHFRAEIKNGDLTETVLKSLELKDGTCFAIATEPKNNGSAAFRRKLRLRVFNGGKMHTVNGKLIFLPNPGRVKFRHVFDQKEIRERNLYALCTNDLGGMSQVAAAWGTVRSKYDAILAANLNSKYPVDRQVMFSRCRAWLVHSDYSQALNLSCLESFRAANANRAEWIFKIPAGQGKSVPLHITLQMPEDGNAVSLHFHRPDSSAVSSLRNDIPVKIILRPDLEDRSNHSTTKAMDGPEKHFRESVSAFNRGFEFKPAADRRLKIRLDGGTFVSQPEWNYMVDLPLERERGLEHNTDMFSPGYFTFELKTGEPAELFAVVDSPGKSGEEHENDFNWKRSSLKERSSVEKVLTGAIKRFVVKRDQYNTVIAGYPWFLDWGRDTLICLRGMIAAGFIKEARNIILQFAAFEKQGTIPNMIRGNDDSNRDTSDAPLWLFIAVNDYCRETGSDSIMREKCGSRTVLEVLKSIIENYRSGTPNGIVMDQESGLVFSPPHFTWMDTNYPACTPRQGYPVEIQALWIAALEFIAHYDQELLSLKEKAAESLSTLYRLPGVNYLSDCLHAAPGVKAADASPDDACRPNQLFAITLGCIQDGPTRKNILRACEQLLVPGAIRSLADAPVKFELPVKDRGKLLNDPVRPFWPEYLGDEDTRRKPAYHNGTAWTWVFPSFCEALFLSGGKNSANRALGLLMSVKTLIESGVAGQIPEILDGAAPHTARGCGAQAWGATEFYRVYKILNPQ
jgi:predicted glycogen debranching enzyme